MVRLLDHIFLSRPILLPPVWTIFLLGYNRSVATNGESGSPFLVLVLLSFLTASIYIINQICDIQTDRINRKLFLLADHIISEKRATLQAIAFDLVSVTAAYAISPTLGVLFTLGLILGLLYSLPPFALKNRSFGGLLSNVLAHGSLVFLIGWCANFGFSPKALLYSTPYLFAVGSIYLNTTIPDKEGDRKTGKMTPAVKWGEFSAKLTSVVFCFLCLTLSLILKDYPLLIAASFSLLLFAYALFTSSAKTVILVTKMGILSLSVVAGFFYPWYFILLLSLYIVAKMYYQLRFGMNYPSLSGE